MTFNYVKKVGKKINFIIECIEEIIWTYRSKFNDCHFTSFGKWLALKQYLSKNLESGDHRKKKGRKYVSYISARTSNETDF